MIEFNQTKTGALHKKRKENVKLNEMQTLPQFSGKVNIENKSCIVDTPRIFD